MLISLIKKLKLIEPTEIDLIEEIKEEDSTIDKEVTEEISTIVPISQEETEMTIEITEITEIKEITEITEIIIEPEIMKTEIEITVEDPQKMILIMKEEITIKEKDNLKVKNQDNNINQMTTENHKEFL